MIKTIQKKEFGKTKDCYSCVEFLEAEIKCVKFHPHKHVPKLNCNDHTRRNKK